MHGMSLDANGRVIFVNTMADELDCLMAFETCRQLPSPHLHNTVHHSNLIVFIITNHTPLVFIYIFMATRCCGCCIVRGVVPDGFGVTFRGDKDVERTGLDDGVESLGI